MKPYFLLLLFPALLVFSGCTSQDREVNELEGVWKLVQGTMISPDTTTVVTENELLMMKIITKSHYFFVEMAPERPVFTEGGSDAELLAAAKTFFAGGGTYTLDEDKYTEHIKFFFTPNFVNTSIAFDYEMQGKDRWVQTGIFPTKAVGLLDYDMELREEWERVE